MSTPISTPRTDAEAGTLIDADEVVPADFARTLERELSELLAVNATGAARLAHATVQLAAERERSRLLLVAMNERDDGYTESRKRMSALESALNAERKKVQMLRNALQSLHDEQNGAPLRRRRDHWQMAMNNASSALAATEDTP